MRRRRSHGCATSSTQSAWAMNGVIFDSPSHLGRHFRRPFHVSPGALSAEHPCISGERSESATCAIRRVVRLTHRFELLAVYALVFLVFGLPSLKVGCSIPQLHFTSASIRMYVPVPRYPSRVTRSTVPWVLMPRRLYGSMVSRSSMTRDRFGFT